MYKITKAKDDTLLGITEKLNYIKRAENGCFVICPELDASGIVFKGNPYHLLGKPELEGCDTVAADPVDGGAILWMNAKTLADNDAINVDQEYRITMAEMGLNNGGGESV